MAGRFESMPKKPQQPQFIDLPETTEEQLHEAGKVDEEMIRAAVDETREKGRPPVLSAETVAKGESLAENPGYKQIQAIVEQLKTSNRQLANFDLVPGLMETYTMRLYNEGVNLQKSLGIKGAELRARVLERAAEIATELHNQYQEVIRAALENPDMIKQRTKRPPQQRAA